MKTIEEAKRAGVNAFNSGIGRAPALNKSFVAAACASSVSTIKLFEAYLRGWDVANLAKDASPEMPSSRELESVCK